MIRYLKTLKDAELVECLNEDDKRYRFHSITEKRQITLTRLKKNTKTKFYNIDLRLQLSRNFKK